MIEITLGIVLLGVLGLFGWYITESNKEKAKLVNALIARTSKEMSDLTIADQTQIKIKPVDSTPDLVPVDSMSDDEFDEHIKRELEDGTEQ